MLGWLGGVPGRSPTAKGRNDSAGLGGLGGRVLRSHEPASVTSRRLGHGGHSAPGRVRWLRGLEDDRGRALRPEGLRCAGGR